MSGDAIIVGARQGDIGASADFGAAHVFVNATPTITAVANQTVSKDTATSALAFSVADVESSASSLTMSGSSSVTTLVPNANITFGGSEASRTVTVTPAVNQIGTTTITLSVSDGAATTSTTFTLRVGSYAPFTDDELTAGSSAVRVAHIAELCTRVDALRQGAGLTPYSYTGSTLIAGSTGILRAHVLDLRTTLRDVYVARGIAIPVYTDPVACRDSRQGRPHRPATGRRDRA